MAANKGIAQRPDYLTKVTKDMPGPGAYSPRGSNFSSHTADKAIKYGGSMLLGMPLETIKSS